jgi:hypothetical protein
MTAKLVQKHRIFCFIKLEMKLFVMAPGFLFSHPNSKTKLSGSLPTNLVGLYVIVFVHYYRHAYIRVIFKCTYMHRCLHLVAVLGIASDSSSAVPRKGLELRVDNLCNLQDKIRSQSDSLTQGGGMVH